MTIKYKMETHRYIPGQTPEQYDYSLIVFLNNQGAKGWKLFEKKSYIDSNNEFSEFLGDKLLFIRETV